MSERERTRSAYPEIAEAVDFLRSRGAKIDAAWVTDADGVVVAGRRPAAVMDEVWVDADRWLEMQRDLKTHYEIADKPKRGKK